MKYLRIENFMESFLKGMFFSAPSRQTYEYIYQGYTLEVPYFNAVDINSFIWNAKEFEISVDCYKDGGPIWC